MVYSWPLENVIGSLDLTGVTGKDKKSKATGLPMINTKVRSDIWKGFTIAAINTISLVAAMTG